MDEIVEPRQGLATADNNRFLRLWWEVDINRIKFDASSRDEASESGKKWFPYNKGGSYRRWYGNYDYVVNWENDGYEIRNFVDDKGKQRSRPQNTDFYFQEAITWSDVTSGSFSLRYRKAGSIHDVTGMSAFLKSNTMLSYMLGLLNTKIGDHIFKLVNPTMHLQIGNFQTFPVIFDTDKTGRLIDISQQSIFLATSDWEGQETDWSFERSCLL